MPRISGPFWIGKRPKTRKFQITLYPASGLSPEICQNWQRKGFSRLPLELAVFREPKTKASAEAGAPALIEYLKNRPKTPDTSQNIPLPTGKPQCLTVGSWLERLASLDNNPHAARLMAEGAPYSPDTLALYKMNFNCHLKNDPFMAMDIEKTEQSQALAFIARIGNQQTKDGRNADI
jgi:hypothetical protein